MMLTLLPVTAMADETTVVATLDKTNYTGGYLRVEAYNKDGDRVDELGDDCENFDSMEFTKDGYVVVMALGEFTVSADGATVGPMQNSELNFYEITGFTKNTTIVINPEPSVVSTFDVQFDWSKVPSLEVGMTIENFMPEGVEEIGIGDACFKEVPASVSGAVEAVGGLDRVGWAIRVNDSFIIDEEEADEIIAEFGDTQEIIEAIEDYNYHVNNGIEDYNGWLPLEIFLSCACKLGYEINENDTYAVWIGIEVENGNIFAEPNAKNEYSGEIDSNVEVGSSIYLNNKELVVFFKLGTLAEMEEQKNGGSEEIKPPVEAEKGNVDVDTKVDAEAPIQNITLGNNEKELLENSNIFKDEEKELIASGVDSKVWLEVGKVAVETLKENDKVNFEKAAKEAVGSATNIVYFEADLFKQLGTANPEKIKNPGVKIKITFEIPSELLNKDKNVERTYKILRLHDGKVEAIAGEFDAEAGKFTFETDKFSTYGIVWKDIEKTSGTTPTPTPTPDPTPAPNSGDSAMVGLYMALVVVGAAVVLKGKKVTNV